MKSPSAPTPPPTIEAKGVGDNRAEADLLMRRRRGRRYAQSDTVLRSGGDLYGLGGSGGATSSSGGGNDGGALGGRETLN